MKIPASIRTLYGHQEEICKQLKTRVDALLRPSLQDRWHYESRVKTIESFTLKIESARFSNPGALEDFFAATIVVRNGLEIADAVRIVNKQFAFAYRRPETDITTHKAADAFPFDDLRLYVRWADAAALPPTGLDGTLFEVQIKTFLQHAWAIATHDLIYKADDTNWSTMRIAYQIKAMLEHAELSIQEAAQLSQSASLAKSDERTTTLKAFIVLVTDLWGKEHLPGDVRRLAENIMSLARLVRLAPAALRSLLEEEKTAGRGPLTNNLTPYGAVLQTLLDRKQDDLDAALKKHAALNKPNKKPAVFISAENTIPQGLNTQEWNQAAVFTTTQETS